MHGVNIKEPIISMKYLFLLLLVLIFFNGCQYSQNRIVWSQQLRDAEKMIENQNDMVLYYVTASSSPKNLASKEVVSLFKFTNIKGETASIPFSDKQHTYTETLKGTGNVSPPFTNNELQNLQKYQRVINISAYDAFNITLKDVTANGIKPIESSLLTAYLDLTEPLLTDDGLQPAWKIELMADNVKYIVSVNANDGSVIPKSIVRP